MRYPFSPEILEAMPEKLAELYRGLEITLLKEISEQLALAGKSNTVTIQHIQALRSHGIPLDEIKKAIRQTTKVSSTELNTLFEEVIERNQAYYTSAISLADITLPETLVDAATIASIVEQTHEEINNINRSMGFLVDAGQTMLPPAKAYQWALDNAAMQVASGAVSYNKAIANATRQLADSGLKVVEYESGHVDQVDVAVRRAVMTGINQVNRQYDEAAMHEFKTDLVEVEAHAGARDKGVGFPNHKSWQGRIYRWAKFTKLYPGASKGNYKDFEETCGLGDVQGILGANCRHSYHAFIEGVMEPTYTEEQLQNIDPPDFKFEGKTYTHYEATQKQREIERTIRKLEREKAAYDAAGLKEDAQAVNVRIRRLKEKYKEFSSAADLRMQPQRMKASYTDSASQIKAAALKEKRDAEATIRVAIRGGEYPLTINVEKQARHMAGTAQSGSSVITIGQEELQKIINANAGSGKILLNKKTGVWTKKELIAVGKEIGYTVNKKGDIIKTQSIKIHYSKTGVHAVPFSGRWRK